MLAGQMRSAGWQARRPQAQPHRSCSGTFAPCSARTALGLARRTPAARRRGGRQISVLISAQQAGQLQSQVAVVLGSQWGDEGKGKLVDVLAQQYDIVARAQVQIVCQLPTAMWLLFPTLSCRDTCNSCTCCSAQSTWTSAVFCSSASPLSFCVA